MSEFPAQLQPIYTTASVNQPVEIYAGPLAVECDGTTYEGFGRVALEWLPSPVVRWFFENFQPGIPPLLCGEAQLKIPGFSNIICAQVTSASISGGKGAKPPTVAGYIENGEGRQSNVPLKSVIFHLANFLSYRGKPVRDQSSKSVSASRAVLEAGGWRIILDEITPSPAFPEEDISIHTGFALSHVARLERLDEATFSTTDAKLILDDVYWFFSFCRGRPMPVILPVGLDENGEQAWSEWGSWNISLKGPIRNWYNTFTAKGLEDAFPGFIKRVRDAIWAEPVKLAIYWYLEAGRVGNDSALILAQSAFEILAWTLLVEDRKQYSEKKFDKDVNASQKLRELLTAQAIPTASPTSLRRLNTLAASFTWSDGPAILMGLRNAMVHPTVDNRNKLADVSEWIYFEASSLSLWYLELLLLSLFDYHGEYSNRLILSGWRGQEVEPVPWIALRDK